MVVFDTYDYLDKLIGFRFGDSFYAAFKKFGENFRDERALNMSKYIRYGTIVDKEILLLRYGFSFEDFEWLLPIISFISEEEIIFANTQNLTYEQKTKIEKFLD